MGVEEESKTVSQQQEEGKKTESHQQEVEKTESPQQEEKKTELQQSKEEEAKPQQETKARNYCEGKKLVDPVPEHKAINSVPKTEKCSEESCDRDAVLARVVKDKKFALVKAWEDNEKTKADNKASNRLSDIASWENSKKAVVEAKLRKKEVELEKVKAKYAEKMDNKKAEIHMAAEEKRARVEARRGAQVLKVEEVAAKYRATGTTPKKLLGQWFFTSLIIIQSKSWSRLCQIQYL